MTEKDSGEFKRLSSKRGVIGHYTSPALLGADNRGLASARKSLWASRD